jgi:hypothetical protein
VYQPYLTGADFLQTSRLALVINDIYANNAFLQRPGGAFKRVDDVVNQTVVTGRHPLISRLIPGYVFRHYVLFENVQSASNDHNPNASYDSAFYMLHMAYDTAVPGGQSNTTDPTNSIVTLAGLPL